MPLFFHSKNTRVQKKHSHTFSHSGYKAYFFPKDFFFLLECCANTCFTSLYYHLHQLIALISIDLVPSSIALEVQLKLKLIATSIDINAQWCMCDDLKLHPESEQVSLCHYMKINEQLSAMSQRCLLLKSIWSARISTSMSQHLKTINLHATAHKKNFVENDHEYS